MSASERLWVAFFACAVVILTAMPYLKAAAQPGVEFTGFLFGVEDGNSYIAKMLRGADGDWLFRSPYALGTQSGALVYLPYLLLGKLVGLGAGHSSFVLAFHLFRSASIVALCFATYAFLSVFISDTNLRRLGLTLAILGSGLGWLPLLFQSERIFGSIPLDFYSPETFGFLAVFGIPHLVLARALLLWGLRRHLLGNSLGWQTALLWLAMALCHLVTAALGIGLLILYAAYLALRRAGSWKPNARHLGWVGLGAFPILALNVWSLMTDAYIANWSAQNQILSPHPVHYLLAYGWLFPLGYVGARLLWNEQNSHGGLLLVWLIALPFLIYAPVGIQRRLAEGAWVMLIVVALYALQTRPQWKAAQLGILALALPSTLLLFIGAWQTANNPSLPVFRSQVEAEALSDLGDHVVHNDIVLTSYSVGSALPAWAPARVMIGHGPEGMNQAELSVRIADFFDDLATDQYRQNLLQEYSVDFVFWGPEERNLGKWDPAEAGYLEPVIEVGEVQVFRVHGE